MDPARIVGQVRGVAERFASDRHARQRGRELEPADFAALAEAGLLLTGVPARLGGVFESVARSSRPIGEILTLNLEARAIGSAATSRSSHCLVARNPSS